MAQIPEQRYRQLFENVRDLLYTIAPDGRITSLNPAFETLTGWSRDEWLGRPVQDLIHPDDVPGVMEEIERASRGLPTPLRIVRIRTRSGEYKSMECSSTQDKTGDQRAGVLGVVRDISERTRAEDALRRSEELFRQVVEHIQEVFWLSDPSKDRMLYISPAYEEIWGRTCEGIYASPRSWLNAIHVEDRLRVTEAALTQQTEGRYDETYRIVRPDGSIRWIHDRAFPIRDRSGQVYRICGIAADITNQKVLEENLHELTMRLEGIREEERRRIALDLHDQLGQNLTTIKLYLGWMRESIKDASSLLPLWQSRLDLVNQDVDQALEAVHQICFQLRPAALDELGLSAAVQLQAAEFGKLTGVSCEVDIALDDTALTTDLATAFFRIVQEALTNVVRYAHATTVHITLAMEGSEVKVEVRDNGIGIDESKLHDRRSLGLLGIRERLRPFGGRLEVTKDDGGGTRLTAWVPWANGRSHELH